MKVHQHKTNTGILGKPEGVSTLDCEGLPITRVQFENVCVIFSYWRPTPEELAALNAGKSVRLSIWGVTHAPVYIGVEGDNAVPLIPEL